MNTIMKDLKETNYIIIDVRFNGGGQDEVALEVLRYVLMKIGNKLLRKKQYIMMASRGKHQYI